MQQKNKLPYILEITWLVVTLLTAGIAIHSFITRGLKESTGLMLLVLLPLGIYFLRRRSRKM